MGNFDFYQAMLSTARQCGINILSDDFCCRLLAWVYIFGGDSEKITHNVKLRTDIKEAQKRLNAFGGEVPNKDLIGLFRKYAKECGDSLNPIKPNWVLDIESKYELNNKK